MTPLRTLQTLSSDAQASPTTAIDRVMNEIRDDSSLTVLAIDRLAVTACL